MPILVKDIMSKPVQKIDSDANVELAGRNMAKARIDSIIVVKKGNAVGILTDSDLIKKIVAKNIKPSSIKVAKVMSEPLVSVAPEETVLEASRKMRRNNIKRLPVISKGNVVGIISTSDIARTVPEMVDMLEFRIKSKESPTIIKESTTSGMCDSCDNYSENLEFRDGQWLCVNCVEEIESE
jgi:CBS domain-containing protein